MMAAVFEKTFIQDLTGRLIIRYCPEIVFSKDNLSNQINVKLYVGPNEYAGGGTVTATVIRSDGNTVPVSGSISGNVASVTLIEPCMDVPGQMQVFIRLTSGNVKTTIFAGVFTASRTETDTIIDPGTIIPSITELINQIDAAIDSIPADYSTLLGSVAGTYSASKTYAVGDYVWYNGQLYRCSTAITTAEAWTAAHWTSAVISDDVTGLKSAFDKILNNKLIIDFIKGKRIKTNIDPIDFTTIDSHANSAYVLIDCAAGDVFTLTGQSANSNYALWTFCASDGTILSQAGNQITLNNAEIEAPSNAAKLLVDVLATQDYFLYSGHSLPVRLSAIEDEIDAANAEIAENSEKINGNTEDIESIKNAVTGVDTLHPDVLHGFYNSNTGAFVSNNEFYSYNIEVEENEEYYLTGRVAKDAGFCLSLLLDENDQIVQVIHKGSYSEQQTVTDEYLRIPEGVVSLTLTSNATETFALKKVVYYDIDEIKNDINDINTELEENTADINANTEDIAAIKSILSNTETQTPTVLNGFFNANTGAFVEYSGFYSYKIDVTQDEEYYLTGRVGQDIGLCLSLLLDDNEQIVQVIHRGNITEQQSVVDEYLRIPEGVAYLTLTSNKSDLFALKKVVYYDIDSINRDVNSFASFLPFRGKKIVNFGDSIIGNYSAPTDVSTYLANLTGATVYNCGFGGCRMGKHSDTHFDKFSMYQLVNAMVSNDWSAQDTAVAETGWGMPSYFPNHLATLKAMDWSTVDMITIAYGTNDWTGLYLDKESDPYDTGRFAGALRYCIEALYQNFPHIKLCLWTPIYRFFLEGGEYVSDSDSENYVEQAIGYSLPDLVDKEIAVAKDYHVPCIDNYYNLGMDRYNRSYYFPANDGTHPNENGRKLIAQHVAKEIF